MTAWLFKRHNGTVKRDINGYQTLTFLTVFIFKNLLLNVIISDVPMWPCILYMHMISNLTLIHWRLTRLRFCWRTRKNINSCWLHQKKMFHVHSKRGIILKSVLNYCWTVYFGTGDKLNKWATMRENLSSGVCEWHRRRPACAYAQSDQRLCC